MIRTTVYILSIILLAAALGGCGKKRHELKSHAGQVNLELFIAARIENAQEAQRALILGADLEGLDRNGLTPLLAAAQIQLPLITATFNNNLNIVKMLLDKGADVNASGDEGWTALHASASGNFYRIASLLLEKGADPLIKDARGQLPTFYASRQVLNLLKSAEEKAEEKGK